MLHLSVQEDNRILMEKMEGTLAHLAWYWRGTSSSADAKEIVRRYQAILICMLDLGLDHPLDIDSELPDEFMPLEYFNRFK